MKIYRNNKWQLCISCYRKALTEYKKKPNICLKCDTVLAMRNTSNLCKKHFHSIYMNEYIQRLDRKDKELEKRRVYKKKNVCKINKNQKDREKIDILFKLKRRLRHRLYSAVKNNQKTGSAIKDLGCSIEELRNYLESKWQEGMTWENYGRDGWHIDHKIPLASFDLSDSEQFAKACHYTNLQPLWAKDNLTKGDKYEY